MDCHAEEQENETQFYNLSNWVIGLQHVCMGLIRKKKTSAVPAKAITHSHWKQQEIQIGVLFNLFLTVKFKIFRPQYYCSYNLIPLILIPLSWLHTLRIEPLTLVARRRGDRKDIGTWLRFTKSSLFLWVQFPTKCQKTWKLKKKNPTCPKVRGLKETIKKWYKILIHNSKHTI